MNPKCDFKSVCSSQAPVEGDLQRFLRQGEYPPFASAQVFESKFVEVNERGDPISVHNRASCVTIGICAVGSEVPSAMLVAREVPVCPQETTANFQRLSEQPSQQLELSRVLPLEFVELSVHSTEKHHLQLKLASGRCYYLELCAPPERQDHQFLQWQQLISLLEDPEKTSNTGGAVKYRDSGVDRKRAPSPNAPPEKGNNPEDAPNPKQEEECTKHTSSHQGPLSQTGSPTEERGRKSEDSHNFPKPAREVNTKQPKKERPGDTKKGKSPRTAKSPRKDKSPKKEKNPRMDKSPNKEKSPRTEKRKGESKTRGWVRKAAGASSLENVAGEQGVFESKFVEVNERGDPISVHNRASCVTIGICAVGSEVPSAINAGSPRGARVPTGNDGKLPASLRAAISTART
ncbi:uncharacterized protein [Numenius arquata]|uniref:uncharacterized protein n=1 Tax=Numenius arquata TaxID=31919 RepID=UPI003D308955